MGKQARSLPARKGYRKDIILVILLKIVALFLLWELFFSGNKPIQRSVLAPVSAQSTPSTQPQHASLSDQLI